MCHGTCQFALPPATCHLTLDTCTPAPATCHLHTCHLPPAPCSTSPSLSSTTTLAICYANVCARRTPARARSDLMCAWWTTHPQTAVRTWCGRSFHRPCWSLATATAGFPMATTWGYATTVSPISLAQPIRRVLRATPCCSTQTPRCRQRPLPTWWPSWMDERNAVWPDASWYGRMAAWTWPAAARFRRLRCRRIVYLA